MSSLQYDDQPAAGIELPPPESVPSRGREGVVVVVPCLPERERRQPGQITRLIAGRKRPPTEVMTQRVDAEGHVMEKEHAHRSTPQQSSEATHNRTGQRHAEAERDSQPDHHPEWERATDEAQIAVGEQIPAAAGG